MTQPAHEKSSKISRTPTTSEPTIPAQIVDLLDRLETATRRLEERVSR